MSEIQTACDQLPKHVVPAVTIAPLQHQPLGRPRLIDDTDIIRWPGMPEKSTPDWEFKDRDIAILRELTKDPQITSRELAEILNEEYRISVSHVTVSESIREMREAGVYRETIVPNEEYYLFSMFEFKLNGPNFAESWRDALEHIRDDEHTLFYFLADGEYQWKSIMMFPDRETESRWIHDFYKQHGDVVQNLRNSVVTNVLQFGADPDIFEFLDEQGD